MNEQLPLFVYGTLLRGESRHDLVAVAAEEIQEAVMPGARLHDLGAFPMLSPGLGRVQGELIWLRPETYALTLATLDQVEGVDSGLFQRVRRPVLLTGCGPLLDAWVYIGNEAIATNYPVVASGDWRRR